MKKLYLKLAAVTLMVLFAVTVVLSASYAWFVMSDSPAVNGIQVSVSGGSTILIAADMTTTVDGVTYHYPGVFAETLNFAQHDSYAYLQELGGLRPVSTADGINWYIATYYDADDPEVLSGEAVVGQLCSVDRFYLDSFMEYANVSSEDKEHLAKGHYIYLDFWVVSPGSDYKLRISTSDDGGSFVMDLPQPQEDTNSLSGYTLAGSVSSTAASVRVGFLATPDHVTDETMRYYRQSLYYKEQYTSLRGSYQAPGGSIVYSENYRFTIYEPNADAHPNGAAPEGAYLATLPVGLVNGVPTAVNVLDRTAVQLQSRWTAAQQETDTLINQIYQTALLGNRVEPGNAYDFYINYLQSRLAPYVQTGRFVRSSALLSDWVSAEDMAQLETAGAADNVYIIELERNVPQRIRMYVWLEGQDADWDPYNAASSFVLNLEFAGGTD